MTEHAWLRTNRAVAGSIGSWSKDLFWGRACACRSRWPSCGNVGSGAVRWRWRRFDAGFGSGRLRRGGPWSWGFRAIERQEQTGARSMIAPGGMPEAEVADLVQALRQHVLQEAAHELMAAEAAWCASALDARCLWRMVTPSSSRPTMRLLVMAMRKT